jgi:hypothetical protein
MAESTNPAPWPHPHIRQGKNIYLIVYLRVLAQHTPNSPYTGGIALCLAAIPTPFCPLRADKGGVVIWLRGLPEELREFPEKLRELPEELGLLPGECGIEDVLTAKANKGL